MWRLSGIHAIVGVPSKDRTSWRIRLGAAVAAGGYGSSQISSPSRAGFSASRSWVPSGENLNIGELNRVFVAYGAGAYGVRGAPGGELTATSRPFSVVRSTATLFPSGETVTVEASDPRRSRCGRDMTSSGSPPTAARDQMAGVSLPFTRNTRRLSGVHASGVADSAACVSWIAVGSSRYRT
jgi:hypothetical protein